MEVIAKLQDRTLCTVQPRRSGVQPLARPLGRLPRGSQGTSPTRRPGLALALALHAWPSPTAVGWREKQETPGAAAGFDMGPLAMAR